MQRSVTLKAGIAVVTAALLAAVVTGAARGAPSPAGSGSGAETVIVELRVWQRVDDAEEFWVSARPQGGRWDTMGTIPLPRDSDASAYAATRDHRFGDIAIAGVGLRIWQRELTRIYIQACAGACPERQPGVRPLWRLLGKVPLPLDDGFSPRGRYRYGDVDIAVPRGNPRLLADREHLLALRDVLTGTTTLNWDVGTPTASWEGVTVAGTPPRVTGLRLSNRGVTGEIWGHLRGLTGLTELRLDGNALTGAIPARLGRLANLRTLHLAKNQLTGAIPTQLGSLAKLRELRLENNRLAGAIPSQLGDLRDLRKAYLKGNSGFTGCVPRGLGDVRFNDVAQLNLPTCPPGTPPTPPTPLPTYSLTVTATGGGSVSPAGTTTHDEDSELTLTASWDDATHTFTGWGGDCTGTTSTCALTMDANKTVTATFAPLPAERCATPAATDCIRAVYKGAPDDYAQVADIPADPLLTPGSDGRYQVERGQQVTVVTAAPLPTGYTRFYLQRRPLVRPSPTSYERLIPPVGTTYTFTPIPFEGAANLITFDLTAARPLSRPGLKPELGDVVVTTTFQVITPAPAATPTEVPDSSLNGEAFRPGTYAFSAGQPGFPPLIVDIPTSEHQIKWRWAGISAGGAFICLADIAEESILCLNLADGRETARHVAETTGDAAAVRIADVFDYIAASARKGDVAP